MMSQAERAKTGSMVLRPANNDEAGPLSRSRVAFARPRQTPRSAVAAGALRAPRERHLRAGQQTIRLCAVRIAWLKELTAQSAALVERSRMQIELCRSLVRTSAARRITVVP
jgi:hypothetical protein